MPTPASWQKKKGSMLWSIRSRWIRIALKVVAFGRLQCYVDDPVVVKDRPSLRLSLLLTCLLWQALGAKLAWEKMQWGAESNTYVLNCGSSPVPMAPGLDSNARHQPDLPSQTVVLRLPLVTKLSAKHRVTHGWRLMRWRPRPVSWIGFELLSPSSCTGISLEKLFKKSNFDGVGCQMFEPSTVFFMAVQSGEHPLIQSSKDPINIINPGWNQWENHRVLLGVLTIQDL